MDIYLEEIPEYVEPENLSFKREGPIIYISTENGTRNIKTVIINGKEYTRCQKSKQK